MQRGSHAGKVSDDAAAERDDRFAAPYAAFGKCIADHRQPVPALAGLARRYDDWVDSDPLASKRGGEARQLRVRDIGVGNHDDAVIAGVGGEECVGAIDQSRIDHDLAGALAKCHGQSFHAASSARMLAIVRSCGASCDATRISASA